MAAPTSSWDPVAAPPIASTPDASTSAPRGTIAEFLQFAREHKAWWIVPGLLVLAVMLALVLMARGDLTVPDIYKLF